MFRAIVADDESVARRALRDLLEATGKVTVVGEASDGPECLRLWEEQAPDVLFLDIQMPTLNGIEVAEIVLGSEAPPLIAFITGHDEHAVMAFELAAVDYVIKTSDLQALGDRLAETVGRMELALARRASHVDAAREAIARLGERLPLKPSRKLPVKDYQERTVRLLDPSSIMYAQRHERRVVLVTKEREFPAYDTIDRLETRLASEGFVRANRGALINLDYVDHLIPNSDGSYDAQIKHTERKVITVSRARAKALLAALGS